MRERALVAYYNCGPVPSDECSDDAPISIGLGHRYIKKPFEQLLDTILMEPGFIKTEVAFPLRADRKQMIEGALDKEINAIVHERMESVFRRIAGRALITGRAFLFRLSKWDWMFKTGRMLHHIDDIDDPYDEGFREWAFCGRLTLREIDEKLDSLRDYEGAGWNRAALGSLKKYILETTSTEKDTPQEDRDRRLTQPFDEENAKKPLDVYWYFRKNGERGDFGHEKIDLYCVSCYENAAIVKVNDDGTVIQKSLGFDGDGKNNQVLYYYPDAFESIQDCLIPMLLDSRVDGEQELAQIDGTGKIMVPRLLGMEQVGVSLMEGPSSQTGLPAVKACRKMRFEPMRRTGSHRGITSRTGSHRFRRRVLSLDSTLAWR
jgi:hypothetical protein